jgi:RNA polymerase sigma-70 factor (ECF subfamily)
VHESAQPGQKDRLHEARLVVLAQAGDRSALAELLKALQSNLFGYIRHLVGPDGAEDVLQDVFIEIYRHLRALNEPLYFRAWAYRISTRGSFRFLRKRKLWQERHEEDVEMDELAGEPFDTRRISADLTCMMDAVTPASRAVLLLHYQEDLSIQEIAAILQLSTGTVKSRLAYGLKTLRAASNHKTTERKTP